MKTTARSIRLTPFALAAALLTAFLVLFAPLSASAHDALVASSPEIDGTVDTLPSELTLTFSNKLITGEGATEVVVTDASGASVTNGEATVDGAIVTQPLVEAADAGTYHVVWKIVSSDGHPTSGEYSFTVSTSTLTATTAEPTDEPTAQPTTESTTEPEVVSTPSADAADSSGDVVGFWVLGIIGVLVIAAIVILIVSRRGNRSSTGSDASSGR